MLLTSATGATVDGVVPLASTKSIGGISINKQMFPFVKLWPMPNVCPGKHSASLWNPTLPKPYQKSSNSNDDISRPHPSLILMVRLRQLR
ncbi:hypothetical protein G6F55_014109 [Rhizopus delemar]|uniref:Uncharacterized protein n=1 Tax=Rhizopus delemar TaxID=936053 RepID=A0A9P6XQZ1_9FUNG|nr:hypothetical protein G6F55_014109 [Rhizopus delemar]KAG1488027.1 hypothetical protein G6F52_014044 [Rhizopus delemar]KAG1489979.1 hypothetical protein G6F52_013667 [Rhizopus delemar]KAG1530445.1 hypothetical protein G6F50_017314 [Rhizopus delemar]KAG1606618.1 hypothetical protein G6F45_013940 [Rhizopus arrhizus]